MRSQVAHGEYVGDYISVSKLADSLNFCYDRRQSVSYETSYMPFLFDREALKPKGRRTFDKRGHEVEEAEVYFSSISILICTDIL